MIHGLRKTLAMWCGCLALSAAAELHTFTNSDGKSFQGKIVRTANGAVTIRREPDGREFTLPLSKLSAEDQTHAKAWMAANPVLKLVFQSIVKSENREGNGKGSSKSEAYCEIEVKNSHSESTPPLRLYYSLAKSSSGLGNSPFPPSQEALDGSIEIPPIAAFRSVVVRSASVSVSTTKTAKVSERQTSSGTVVLDVDAQTNKTSLEGIAFYVYHGQNRVESYVTPGLDKRFMVRLGSTGYEGPDAPKTPDVR
jgi:hypothetical protein